MYSKFSLFFNQTAFKQKQHNICHSNTEQYLQSSQTLYHAITIFIQLNMMMHIVTLLTTYIISVICLEELLVEYSNLQSSFPTDNIVHSSFQAQEILMSTIAEYVQFDQHHFPVDPIFNESDIQHHDYHDHYDNHHYHNIFDNQQLSIDPVQIHVDIGFIGFPAEAVAKFKTIWFSNLDRQEDVVSYTKVPDDPTSSTSSSFEQDTSPKNPLQVKYNYHILDMSMHVTTALERKLFSVLTPYREIRHGNYININELEPTLHSLLGVITKSKEDLSGGDKEELDASHHYHSERDMFKQTSVPSSLTVFIFNGDVTGDSDKDYSYNDGFLPADLDILLKDSDVVAMAKSIVSQIEHKSKLVISASAEHPPLFDKQPEVLYEEVAKQFQRNFEPTQNNNGVLAASRAWATAKVSELPTKNQVRAPLL